MSKIIREVGFLAIGVAALLEVCIYLRWWSWHGAFAEPVLVASFIILIGAYFALDGTAWSDLARLIERSGSQQAKVKHSSLGKRWSLTWWVDLLALLIAIAVVGVTTHILASFEHEGDAAAHGRNTLYPLMAFLLATYFGMATAYWSRMKRCVEDPAWRDFFEIAKSVWPSVTNAKIFMVLFALATVITVGFAAVAVAGASVSWLVCANAALLLLLIGYVISRFR